MFKLTIVTMVLMLAGCATQQAAFVPAQPSDEKGSVVYVYRASQVSSLMLAPGVNVNTADGAQKKLGKISHGEYRLIYLLPGRYEVELESIEYYAPGNKLIVEVKPETVNYLRLDASLKFETGTRYKSYDRKFGIRQVDTQTALNEIASCIDVESKPKKKSKTAKVKAGEAARGILENDEDAYFSTDKTADPFSRNR